RLKAGVIVLRVQIDTVERKMFRYILPTINSPPYEAQLDVLIESGANVVETAENEAMVYVPKFKAAGVKVNHECAAVRHAITAETRLRRLTPHGRANFCCCRGIAGREGHPR
ncbi:hypothetical protein P3W83_01205, partial [Cupriavidus basilensis]|nr:hypothetical protein [Cupriavidus basilensis]